MVKSNVVTVNVSSPTTAPAPTPTVQPSISSVNLVATTPTDIVVGDSVGFRATVTFNTSLPNDMLLDVAVYINGSLHETLSAFARAGQTTTTVDFTLTFSSAGTYQVYVDVNFSKQQPI